MEGMGLMEKCATGDELKEWLRDAHQRTLDAIGGLNDAQLDLPQIRELNPFHWMVGHVAWFNEYWVLRGVRGRPPLLARTGQLYDSIAIPWEIRWQPPVPGNAEVIRYLDGVLDEIVSGAGGRELSEPEIYFQRLSAFHEDMHSEANTYFRQNMALPQPAGTMDGGLSPEPGSGAELADDVEIPGTESFLLGAVPEEPFVFDNEKWAHPVQVPSFRISRTAVTQEAFQAFVDDGGYENEAHWSVWGKLWRTSVPERHPVYWRPAGGGWQRRHFDRWVTLEPSLPVSHVNWYEAEAYCNWAGRRLPSEAEWELAAAAEPDGAGGISGVKRRYPWGDDPPTPERTNLNGWYGGPVDVTALPGGDSAFGCRQMMGNLWEWVADPFYPYPGFELDPYKEFSSWCFGDRKVLRGGAWITPPRTMRNTWRNFFTPDRRDIFSGFRTCAR